MLTLRKISLCLLVAVSACQNKNITTEKQVNVEPKSIIEQEIDKYYAQMIQRVSLDSAVKYNLNFSEIVFLYMDSVSIHLLTDKHDVSKIRTLDLTNCNLKKVPDFVARFQNLEQLYLRFNSIQSLPEYFSNLKHLKEIYLGDNEFKSFPAQLYQVDSLEVINMSFNRIADLGEVKPMKSVKDINLFNNKISNINLLLDGNVFPSLEKLELMDNDIGESDCEKLQSHFSKANVRCYSVYR